LLGSVSSAAAAGESAVYNHTFGILLNNPQHPSLTLALSKPGIQDYEYPLALVKSLEIRTPVNDLINATAAFIAQKENSHAAFSPVFASNDYYFRHQDVVLKLADSVAGLGAAAVLKVKDFKLNVDNKAKFNQNISELNPSDVIADIFTIEGELQMDLTDTSFHDIFTAGSYKSLQLKMTRSDITIGTASNPSATITLPKVSFESYAENRKIDDIVEQTIKFTAHYSSSDAMAIQAVLTNEKANYNS
jgi:hypothetical protein